MQTTAFDSLPALSDEETDQLAIQLDEAVQGVRAISRLTASQPFALRDAYRIQRAGIALRQTRGDGVIGLKMGLTSRAKMEQMGVHEPIYGHLTREMRLEESGVLNLQAHCHPRVEPEVAFLLRRPLAGPVTPAEALLAVEGVCAALEIIDSRYENFQFTLADVVADNASSSRFVLGTTLRRPEELDVGNLGMVMELNGEVVQMGSSAAIYEHPVRSLAALANLLAAEGETIPAGSIVLAGGATAAVALSAGDRVCLRVDGLGTTRFSVAPLGETARAPGAS